MKKIEKELKKLLVLLKKEKTALLTNNGAVIKDLVVRKEEIIDKIEDIKIFGDIDEARVSKKKLDRLIGEIRELQDINLLLTKQALGFQEEFMSALKDNVEDKMETYSPKGNFNTKDCISLINTSL